MINEKTKPHVAEPRLWSTRVTGTAKGTTESFLFFGAGQNFTSDLSSDSQVNTCKPVNLMQSDSSKWTAELCHGK
jgi:hypothetical protein